MSEADPLGASEAPPPPRSGDLTQGPILRTMMAFSMPMLIANVLQSVSMTINAIWVGRLIGESALAGAASANMVIFLIFSMVFGLGNATTIRVGQLVGASDLPAARQAFAAGVGFCFMLGLGAGLIGLPLVKAMLSAMATPRESMADAVTYLRWNLALLPIGVVSMMLGMGLRGAGDSRTPLYAMIVSVVVAAALNPVLILGLGPFPAMGIAGSALALAVAGLVSMVQMAAMIQLRDTPLRLRGAEWRGLLVPEREALGYILAKGLPMGLQMLALTGAGLIMLGLVNRQGLNAAAAYGASLQLWNYVQMPAMAFGAAVSAMVAQAIGAGVEERVDAITRTGNVVVLAMTGVLGALLVLFGRPLLALFLGGESPALGIGQHILAVSTWSFVVGSYVLIVNSTMRAYGAVIPQLLVMIVSMYPARIGFYFAARPWLGEEAVWWAYPAGTVVSTALAWLVFTRGRWRRAALR